MNISKDFILAGRAVFTAENPKGDHYTFKINKKEFGEKNPVVHHFVNLLTGPDNVSDFTYLGMLDESSGKVALTKASKLKDDSKPVQVVRWVLKMLWENKELPAGYNIHHEGRCGRCGRTLTVPESIRTGIGPECAKR